MKPFLPLALLLFCFGAIPAFCQTAPKFSYLLIQIQRDKDPQNKQKYYKLEAEAGNPNADFIRTLVTYAPPLKENDAAAFFASKSDTAQRYFNYFNSISEALEFLDVQGWRLFSINEKVYSYRGASEYSRGAIESETTYYLRKENP